MIEFEAPRIVLASNGKDTAEAVGLDFTTDTGKKSFVVALGDITKVNADAIAVPANPGFEFFGGGVQGAVARAAGMEVFEEAEAKAKVFIQTEDAIDIDDLRGLPTGYAIPVEAGRLSKSYKNIIHVNSMPRRADSTKDDIEVVRLSVDGTLRAAERLSLESVAFPAFGTGLFGMDLRDSLLGTLSGVRSFYSVTQPNAQLSRVVLVIYSQPSMDNARAAKTYIEQQLS